MKTLFKNFFTGMPFYFIFIIVAVALLNDDFKKMVAGDFIYIPVGLVIVVTIMLTLWKIKNINKKRTMELLEISNVNKEVGHDETK